MDSTVPVGPSPSISDAADSVRRWIASPVLYAELRIRLLALESKEAAVHLLLLAVLIVSALVLFAGFLTMLIVFLLYLLMLIFHWDWAGAHWPAQGCCSLSVSLRVSYSGLRSSNLFTQPPLANLKRILNG